jgi:hypothetical protein
MRYYPNGAFPISPAGVERLAMEGVKREDLRQLGLRAIQRGHEKRCMRTAHILPDAPVVRCFPPLPANWDDVDGTIPFSDEDQSRRFQRGPAWHQNSCAVDCILVAALLLDAGRCRVDQLDERAMKDLAPLPRALLYVIRKPWGLLEPETIDRLRNYLRQMLALHDPGRFPLDRPCGLLSVADELFAGLPQLHATWTYAFACCKERSRQNWQYARTAEGAQALKTKVQRGLPTLTKLHVGPDPPSPQGLRDIVDAGFGDQPLTTSEAKGLPSCGSTACRAPFKVPVLLDRLPPVLILTEENLDLRGSNPPGLYSEVLVSCMGYRLERTHAVRYRIEGYIVYRENHFTLYWQRRVEKSAYYQALAYDGLVNGGKFVYYPSLNSAYPKGAVLGLVFLTRVDD